MGKPNAIQLALLRCLTARSEPGEVKHLSTQRKRKLNLIPLVAASEKGKAQTRPSLFAPQRATERQVLLMTCHSEAPNEVRSEGWGLKEDNVGS